jgi:hypothetical protein
MRLARIAVWVAVPAVLLGADATPVVNPRVGQVHRVYLLSMSNGFDQYLAGRLTESGLFQVVTDPQKAEALFTDRIGDSLEARMLELYPTPEMIAKKKEREEKKAKGEVVDDEKYNPIHLTAYGRGKGMLFLVDRNSRDVLWSIYLRPKNFTPDVLTKTAREIVNQLQKELRPPSEKK